MGGKRGRKLEKQLKIIGLDLIHKAKEDGCRLKIACSDIGIDFKTFRRWKESLVDKRKGPLSAPSNKLTEEEKTKIIEVSTSAEYVDFSPWIIVAKLADKGEYIASESSFYKVLREKKLLEYRGKSKKASLYRPEPLVARGPNEIWSWDITYLKTNVVGQFYYVYLVMDIWSRKIIGFEVKAQESMVYSSELMRRLYKEERIEKKKLTLHSDNGGPMKGATMLATLQKLGVTASFSRPRVSNDNPYSESLFKTLKYCPKYPKNFKSIQEAKEWMEVFMKWYNEQPHSGIKFVTPKQRHSKTDVKLLEKRKKVYELAKVRNPNRWNNRETRNWEHQKKVYLNYLQKKNDLDINIAS